MTVGRLFTTSRLHSNLQMNPPIFDSETQVKSHSTRPADYTFAIERARLSNTILLVSLSINYSLRPLLPSLQRKRNSRPSQTHGLYATYLHAGMTATRQRSAFKQVPVDAYRLTIVLRVERTLSCSPKLDPPLLVPAPPSSDPTSDPLLAIPLY
jgi:hypothetical protein